TGEEFTSEAIEMIYWQSGGVPRLVNKIADFAMVYAVTADKQTVDATIIHELMSDNIFLKTVDPAKDAAE
ncbi:MAG: ATPase, partial [Pseudomonadota bacterium]